MIDDIRRAQVKTREMFWRWVILWMLVAAVLGILEKCKP